MGRAATSADGRDKRLGGGKWKRLRLTNYLIINWW